MICKKGYGNHGIRQKHKKQQEAPQKEERRKEVILVALAIGVFAYSRINKGLKNLGTEMGDQQQTGAEQTGDVQQAAQPEDMADVVINEGVATNEVLTGYTNIALVGIDTRDGDIDYANSDTMLIASVNNDTWGVRMVSLYRDT